MAKESLPIDAAQVVGLFMESVFYGTLLWADGWFKSPRLVNKKMLLATILMFILATLDVAFHLRHNLEAFIYFNGNPIDDFDQTSYWLNVVSMGCYVAQTFVGDAVLLFRCWIVYGRKWLFIAFPMTLWLATTACGVMTIYVESTMDTAGKLLNSKSLEPFITSMLCLTLVTNILTTSFGLALIVLRIWGIRRNLTGTYTPNSPLTNLLIVLIESGLMYTLSILILFGLYMASNNGQYGVSNAGITFNLIITSVDRKESESYNTSTIQQTRSRSNQPAGSLPLHHIISVHTTIDQFPDQDLPRKKRLDSDEDSMPQSSTFDTKM
ncbi:hypothetical protein CPB83DRAFT_868422 [Crepidotus variabilis]|uniref:Uncharacterized protein n=1 Tax=Crepidotus variabilis TaxID=179855 RepID=A0A9P6JSN5_9AGAR|nr:hypothetical protein CPB83DRAFT_868422 [Crepidotus variabilis]